MTLSLANFTTWQKESGMLSEVRTWLAHIGKRGRGGDVLRLSPAHCKGIGFTVAGQYTEGGTNYWESSTAFNEAMKEAVLARFPELAAEAVAILEKKVAASLAKAEGEMVAVQDAIAEAKTLLAA